MSRAIAISDIHGCLKTFKALIESEVKLEKSDKLYLLGDYIDRGPDSKGVLDYILQLISEKYDVTVLKGNHEEMLLRSIHDQNYLTSWLINGGDKTLDSFKINLFEEMPSMYVDFIRSMGSFKVLDSYILVHAGINFTLENPFEDLEAMLWLRTFIVDPAKSGNRTVVHGHTPISRERIEEYIRNVDKDRRINIDNGCVYKSYPHQAHLCALELNTRNLYFQPNID
jgi:serine/threonine protein phosphatase 1